MFQLSTPDIIVQLPFSMFFYFLKKKREKTFACNGTDSSQCLVQMAYDSLKGAEDSKTLLLAQTCSSQLLAYFWYEEKKKKIRYFIKIFIFKN